MVSIYVNGEDKTQQISDWRIWYNNQKNELMLSCIFLSGKEFYQPLTNCKVEPTNDVNGCLLVKKGQSVIKTIEKAQTYGGKFTIVYFPNNDKPYVMKTHELDISSESDLKNNEVYKYFLSVAQIRIDEAKNGDKVITGNVLRQLEKITSHPSTALYAYCIASNKPRTSLPHYIYPFGVNESQLQAVENAFSSQISIIEGPPGTGKTQTILNIVANILLNQKTVVILSNNNSAVENVYEKLAKENLDYLVAKLGSSENRNKFFDIEENFSIDEIENETPIEKIDATLNRLKAHLHAQNQVALLKAQIDELIIEQKYLQQWYNDSQISPPPPFRHYKLSPEKTADLLAYLNILAERRTSFSDRIRLLFNFKIIRTKYINNLEQRQALVYALQLFYYEKVLKEKNEQYETYKSELEHSNFKQLLKNLTQASMEYLKYRLKQNINLEASFTVQDYRRNFDKFIQRFPIIGSSTHSVVNSLANGALLDYVIIDEASQQDIIPGILGLGCAKNVIIVGDRKQLPHIPVDTSVESPKEDYDCVKYSLLDSFINVFRNDVPITLLKEHYRCHPKIIQFCNKQFYDNQLIPMISDQGEAALELIITAKGNHTRNNSNLRELESIEAVGYKDDENTGFIAPYNNQVNLSQKHLGQGVVKATAHKFQGRECEKIIFSTVLDKKLASQKQLMFVDDPHLVNVAVSRAKEKFTLVTGNNVFTKNNQSIAALVRYIQYYADQEQLHDSPVISAFDLLYDEYDKSLENLKTRLNPKDSKFKSEQIATQLLREILAQERFQSIKFHMQVKLIQLVMMQKEHFSKREQQFIQNGASCDFVLYYKVGKTPLGVIEVDGGYHETLQQTERDYVKNSILEKTEIPLLRLKTIDSRIKFKITEFLKSAIENSNSITNRNANN